MVLGSRNGAAGFVWRSAFLNGFLSFLTRVKVSWNVQQTVVVFFSFFLLYGYIADLANFVPYYVKPGRERLYLAGAEELEKATPPGAFIGSTGGGVVAYFIKDRTIINLDGLMNTTEYFRLLKEGPGYRIYGCDWYGIPV